MYSFIQTISTRSRRSLQVLILQFNSRLSSSEFVGLSCLFLSVRLSRVFTSLRYSATTVEIQLEWSFILTVVGVFVHVNRMVG